MPGVKYLTWKHHDCCFSSLAVKNLRRTVIRTQHQPGGGEYLLLIRAWQEVEHAEERLNIKLCKEPQGA
jgi:hypothetical protein